MKNSKWFKITRKTEPKKISISIGNPNKIDLNKCWGIALTNEGDFYRASKEDEWSEFVTDFEEPERKLSYNELEEKIKELEIENKVLKSYIYNELEDNK